MPPSDIPGVRSVLFLRAVVNAFLVDADVLTLIDTGTPGGAAKVVDALRAGGHEPGDVQRILLTHRHGDHAGNAAELARLTGAEVHASPLDGPFISEGREQPRPRPATPLGYLMVPYVKVALPWSVAPVALRETLVDGAAVGAFRVVATPGHTPGHVSLLWEQRGVLFTADAAANITSVGPHPAADDPHYARESFRRLTDLPFDAACFGHGRSIAAGAAARFRAAA
jgi:glyoxylase-like metal-dependent hydrolase (beta-lactamase superfamily II)